VFIERCKAFTNENHYYGLVSPQNWLFLESYSKMRGKILQNQIWKIIARLGPRAFETISGEVVKVALLVYQNGKTRNKSSSFCTECSFLLSPQEKAKFIAADKGQLIEQAIQLNNPDQRSFQTLVKAPFIGICGYPGGGGGAGTLLIYFSFWSFTILLDGFAASSQIKDLIF
jgi:type I restriction-modification system DNA methylase subunit